MSTKAYEYSSYGSEEFMVVSGAASSSCCVLCVWCLSSHNAQQKFPVSKLSQKSFKLKNISPPPFLSKRHFPQDPRTKNEI